MSPTRAKLVDDMIDGATARAQGLWLGAESGTFQSHSSLLARHFKRLSSLLECHPDLDAHAHELLRDGGFTARHG
jgi:hypothetical protein